MVGAVGADPSDMTAPSNCCSNGGLSRHCQRSVGRGILLLSVRQACMNLKQPLALLSGLSQLDHFGSSRTQEGPTLRRWA